MKKRQFVPSVPDALEGRALLSGFKFPPSLGPVTTLNYRGNWVLTSRTYGEVQNSINKAFQAFAAEVSRAFNHLGGFTPAFYARVGVGTLGPNGYAPGTLLAKIDSIMTHVEFRLPYGGGAFNVTGGVGLSTRTAPGSQNPAVINLGRLSVAQQLENAVGGAATPGQVRVGIETVRQVTLNINGRAPLAWGTGAIPGTLASYVRFFGPGGARDFGLKNS